MFSEEYNVKLGGRYWRNNISDLIHILYKYSEKVLEIATLIFGLTT